MTDEELDRIDSMEVDYWPASEIRRLVAEVRRLRAEAERHRGSLEGERR